MDTATNVGALQALPLSSGRRCVPVRQPITASRDFFWCDDGKCLQGLLTWRNSGTAVWAACIPWKVPLPLGGVCRSRCSPGLQLLLTCQQCLKAHQGSQYPQRSRKVRSRVTVECQNSSYSI